MHYRILFVLSKLQNCIARLNHLWLLTKNVNILSPVVKKADNALSSGEIPTQLVSQIDPVHSPIHLLNNRGQMKKVTRKELVLRQAVEELKKDGHIMFETSEKAIDSLTAYSMKEWAILGTRTAGGVRDQRSIY